MIRETQAYYTGTEKIAHGQKLKNIVEHVGRWFYKEHGAAEGREMVRDRRYYLQLKP